MEELSRLSLLIGENQIKKVKEKCVLILGAGGVGGYVIESLVRSGVGKIIIADYDTIDKTNINRQIIALQSNIGKSKVEVFQKRIADILPTCQVIPIEKKITEENIASIFEEKIDFAVDACDTISTKLAFIKYCLEHKILFLTVLGTGKRMDPWKLEITELSKTSNDPLARILRKKVKEANIKEKIKVVYSSELPKKIDSKVIASSIFVPSSAGILAASYVIQKLLEGE